VSRAFAVEAPTILAAQALHHAIVFHFLLRLTEIPSKRIKLGKMWHPNCKTKACELCQGGIPWQDSWQAPSYMHLTRATRSRNAETREARRYTSPKKSPKKERRTQDSNVPVGAAGSANVPARPVSGQKQLTFLDLPLEIRRIIYGFSLRDKSADLRSDVEGGSKFHSDAPRCRTDLRLAVDFRPSIPLLQSNKQIYSEAREEIYRQIPLHLIDLHMWDIKEGRANYWLREHPFRFTKEVIFEKSELRDAPFSLAERATLMSLSIRGNRYMDFLHRDTEWLAKALNAMKHLRKVRFHIKMWLPKHWYYLTSFGGVTNPIQLSNLLKWLRQSSAIAVTLNPAINVSLAGELDIYEDRLLRTFVRRAVKALKEYEGNGAKYVLVEEELKGFVQRKFFSYQSRIGAFRLERRYDTSSVSPSVAGPAGQ
jgi:hypothetical protein